MRGRRGVLGKRRGAAALTAPGARPGGCAAKEEEGKEKGRGKKSKEEKEERKGEKEKEKKKRKGKIKRGKIREEK
jgi:hypothetical protein